MKLLVSGREGQVARSLAERAGAASDLELVFVARPGTDLAEPGAFASAILEHRPDVVVNAAAFTAVDRAEDEEALAYRINADAAGEGALAAARTGARFVQISTDYVFDGSGDRPWQEEDAVRPINAYGRSKAASEQQVLAADPKNLAVRTSWLYSPFGQNFVRTMLRLAVDRDEISVVDDQRGCPTSTLDLADGLFQLVRLSAAGKASGIVHLAGQGVASWADLAESIFSASAAIGGPSAIVRRIPSSAFPLPAKRPANSALDCTRAAALGLGMPPWRASVQTVVERILRGE